MVLIPGSEETLGRCDSPCLPRLGCRAVRASRDHIVQDARAVGELQKSKCPRSKSGKDRGGKGGLHKDGKRGLSRQLFFNRRRDRIYPKYGRFEEVQGPFAGRTMLRRAGNGVARLCQIESGRGPLARVRGR